MTDSADRTRARRLIGAAVESIPTPALVLEPETMRSIIAEMARRMAPLRGYSPTTVNFYETVTSS